VYFINGNPALVFVAITLFGENHRFVQALFSCGHLQRTRLLSPERKKSVLTKLKLYVSHTTLEQR